MYIKIKNGLNNSNRYLDKRRNLDLELVLKDLDFENRFKDAKKITIENVLKLI